MPTIDELAPATAASDADEILVSQGGVTRKISRSQVLAGVQPALALPAGSLLGRVSAGTGVPESIFVGANLTLSGTTLAANATPFSVGQLSAGTVPAAMDLVPLGQSGTNTAVTFGQFLSGLPNVTNVDVSQTVVTPAGTTGGVKLADLAARILPVTGGTMTGPLFLSGVPTATAQAATKGYVDTQTGTAVPITGGILTGPLALAADPVGASQAATKRYVDYQVGLSVPLTGGTITGPLMLASAPTSSLQAATKQYVDVAAAGSGVINVKAAPYNAQLNGTADDTAAFKAAYVAASAGSVIYVPFGVTVLQGAGSWGVPLTKRVKWIVDGTTLADGTPLAAAIPNGTAPAAFVLPGVVVGNTGFGAEVSQGSSQSSDFAVSHGSYIVNHNGGSGSVVTNSRNDTFIYNSPNNFVWGGLDRLVWAGVQTPAASSPAQHVGRYMQTIRQTIATDSSGKALPQPQLWTSVLEYRDATGRPSSWANAAITVEMDWFGNGADDGGSRQIQSLVVGQHDTAGAPVQVSSIIGVYLAGGHKGQADKVFNVGIPFATSVLDTTNSQQLSGASAIRLAAGHSIAFEASGSNRLVFDSATSTLRWVQGSLSYAVGKGITVGWQNVISGNFSIPGYLSGNIMFLVGTGSYTVTLPPAIAVAAGVGFTFSAIGTATVSIVGSGSDTIDNAPIILRQNDRYHLVSDNSNAWREVFRTNAVNPRFSGPPILPSYTVVTLPSSPGAGAKAFAVNGRKPSEAAGAGSGVEVFYDGVHWIASCSGTVVAA